jgi:hypothetical protein
MISDAYTTFKEKPMERDESKAKGGFARAEALSPEERKEIARKAAQARWDGNIPKAKCEGSFKIGQTTILAAVLPNGKRLLTQATFLRALGRSRSPKVGTGVLATVDGIPAFLQANVLKPFVTEELLASTTPYFYLDLEGRRAVGYDAELLPKTAEVYLKFRDGCLAEGRPVPRQYDHIVTACDIVMRGLAHVGIVALVDEATGFQNERARDALAQILEQFIAKELKPYVRAFPLDFFRELCRLRDIPFRDDMKLPPYFGKLVNNLVYCRLAPGVLAELQRKNPVRENGRRKDKNYQWLTENVGHPKLLQLLGSEVTLMRMSRTWDDFKPLVDKYHPPHKDLPLFDWAESGGND